MSRNSNFHQTKPKYKKKSGILKILKKRVGQTVKSLKFYLKAKKKSEHETCPANYRSNYRTNYSSIGWFRVVLKIFRNFTGDRKRIGENLEKKEIMNLRFLNCFNILEHDSFLGTFHFKIRPHHKLSCPILCQFIFEPTNERLDWDLINDLGHVFDESLCSIRNVLWWDKEQILRCSNR